MKTKAFFTLCCLASTIMVMRAQDIITKTNGDQIKAKVTEVDINEVKYKRFDNVSGPTYTIAKSDVFMIKYENGEKDMFQKTSNESDVSDQTSTQDPSSSESVKQKLQATRQALRNSPQTGQSTTQQQNTPASTSAIAPKTRWGIKAGLNVATVTLSNGSNSQSLESVAGAVAGITLEAPFSPKWFFHSGLEFSMKGFGIKDGSTTLLTSRGIYAQLPVAIGYKFNIGKGWKLEPRLGIYFAYGFAGNTTVGSVSGSTFGEKILNPFDFGMLFGGFFDNGQYVIGIHGESGLTDTNGDNFKVTGATANSSNFSITLGYLF